MELRRLSRGERVAGVSAVLLFLFTFLDWYGVSVFVYGRSISWQGNAWDILEVTPILLVVGIAATFGLIALKASGADRELAIDGAQMIAVLGAISFLLILYRIIERPTFGSPPYSVEASAQVGIFLALIAAAGIAFGGWRAMQEDDFWSPMVGGSPISGGDGAKPASGGPSPSASGPLHVVERPSGHRARTAESGGEVGNSSRDYSEATS